MRSQRRRFSSPRLPSLIAPVCGALLVLVTACGRPAPEPAQSSTGPAGTAVVAASADIEGVNPLIVKQTEFNRNLELRLLFQTLVEEQADFRSGPPTFEPALAESWSFSDDRLQLTFVLREGLAWSDGAPLTARDVRWTWQAQTAPEIAWGYAGKKESIEDVEVVDDRTVRFHFTDTYPAQLADANEGAILPEHAWGERPFAEWRDDAGWFEDRAVFSGPFRLVEWRPNSQLDLARNDSYWNDGLPKLERLVFRVVPDKTAQVSQLLSGELDYVEQLPRDELERLRESPGVEVDDFWSRQYNYLCWNTRHPLFTDPEVRRALTMAIDRQQMIDTLYRGYARLSVSPILSTAWAFNRRIEPWPYDPKVARLILAKKGYADDDGDGYLERDGERFSFELVTNAGNRALIDAGTMIQEQLRQAGIEVALRSLEFSTWVERVTGHEFEASLGAWNIDTSLDVGYAFHSDSIDGSYNFGSYANPEVDRLIDESNRVQEVEQKRELLLRLQEILHDDQPYTFLLEPKRINARRVRLRGTRPTAISSFDNIEEWWVQ